MPCLTQSLAALAISAGLAMPSLAQPGDPSYFTLSINNSQVGYAMYESHRVSFHNHPALKTESTAHISVVLEGQKMNILSHNVCFYDTKGSPLEMRINTRSGGKLQTIVAKFLAGKANISANNDGVVAHRLISIPKGFIVTDDPITVFLGHKQESKYLLLDPTTISFVKNTIEPMASKKPHTKLLKIADPRDSTYVLLDEQNHIIEVNAPMGLVMRPSSKLEAVRKTNSKIDVEDANKLEPTGQAPDDLFTASHIRLMIKTKSDLTVVPSDDNQTITHSDNAWFIDVHPPLAEVPAKTTISQAAQLQPAWIKPDLYIPSNSARFKNLALKIIKQETDVAKAAGAIQKYVYSSLQSDAGMGILRDANDVLNSKRGVCRDYAILTTTLLRASGIPARLATGLISWDGPFYYHAWVEYFNGRHWIGLDSTTDRAQLSAGHIKLASGTVEKAFLPLFLESANLTWLPDSSVEKTEVTK